MRSHGMSSVSQDLLGRCFEGARHLSPECVSNIDDIAELLSLVEIEGYSDKIAGAKALIKRLKLHKDRRRRQRRSCRWKRRQRRLQTLSASRQTYCRRRACLHRHPTARIRVAALRTRCGSARRSCACALTTVNTEAAPPCAHQPGSVLVSIVLERDCPTAKIDAHSAAASSPTPKKALVGARGRGCVERARCRPSPARRRPRGHS